MPIGRLPVSRFMATLMDLLARASQHHHHTHTNHSTVIDIMHRSAQRHRINGPSLLLKASRGHAGQSHRHKTSRTAAWSELSVQRAGCRRSCCCTPRVTCRCSHARINHNSDHIQCHVHCWQLNTHALRKHATDRGTASSLDAHCLCRQASL